jgi:hypothetical protein
MADLPDGLGKPTRPEAVFHRCGTLITVATGTGVACMERT